MGSTGSTISVDLPSTLQAIPLELVHVQNLGGARDIKSMRCHYLNGNVVVKVYAKRALDESLQKYQDDVNELKRKLIGNGQSPDGNGHTDCPGVVPYEFTHEAQLTGFLVRPYFATSLYDRFHTHPFLIPMEKRWLCYQLLRAVKQLHSKDILHLAIKSENIMVNSWNGLFLTDIASFYKPEHLPADSPALYNQFYATGRRLACYVAPERFYARQMKKVPITQAADIFSVGCVIADIFLDGREALFDHSQMLQYKEEKYDPTLVISKIEHPIIQELIKSMISLNQEERLSAADYLEKFDSLFPSYFEDLYNFFKFMALPQHASSDKRVKYVREHFDQIVGAIMKLEDQDIKSSAGLTRSSSVYLAFQEPESLPTLRDYTKAAQRGATGRSYSAEDVSNSHCAVRSKMDEIHDFLSGELKDEEQDYSSKFQRQSQFHSADEAEIRMNALPQRVQRLMSNYRLQTGSGVEEQRRISLSMLRHAVVKRNEKALNPISEDETLEEEDIKNEQESNFPPEDGLVPIVSLLCSLVRSAKMPVLKLLALELLHELACFVNDDIRLGRIVPYTVALITESRQSVSATLRATGLTLLAQTLDMVETVGPADANIFPDYIFSSFSSIPNDSEELVALTYAQNTAKFAEIAKRFLEISHSVAANQENSFDEKYEAYVNPMRSFDEELDHLRTTVLKIVQAFVAGSSSRVKIAFLSDVTRLSIFFGREKVNEEILPSLTTFLNEKDWELRAAFFEYIIGIGVFVGPKSLEACILPFAREHGIYDEVDHVVVRTVESLTVLCELDLFDTNIIDKLSHRVSPLLCHPCSWIRRSAIQLISSFAEKLGLAKSYAFLAARLRYYIVDGVELFHISKESLTRCLRPPLSWKCYRKTCRKYKQKMAISGEVRHSMLQRSQDANYTFEEDDKFDIDEDEDEELLSAMHSYFECVAKKVEPFNRNNGTDFVRTFSRLNEEVQLHRVLISNSIPKLVLQELINDAKEDYLFDGSMINPTQVTRMRPKAQHLEVVDKLHQRLTTNPDFDLGVFSKPPIYEKLSSVDEQVQEALSLPPDMPNIGQYDLKESHLSRSSFYRNHRPPYLTTSPEDYRPTNWRPKGTLVAELCEHKDCVNALSVSRDNLFMASASDDGTVKIWDAQSLKTFSPQSRLTYSGQMGKILDTVVLDCSHSFASASTNGTIHVCKVDCIADNSNSSNRIYQGCSNIKVVTESEGAALCVDHANSITESLIVYGTQGGVTHGWDLRTRIEPWHLSLPGYCGSISQVHFGPSIYSLVVGTSRGYVAVWDLRFQVPVQLWRHSSKNRITHLYSIASTSCLPDFGTLYHPESGPLLFISGKGANEITAFDIYTAEAREIFRVLPESDKNIRIDDDSSMKRKSIRVESRNRRKLGSVFHHISNLALPSLHPYLGKSLSSTHFPGDYDMNKSFEEYTRDEPYMSGLLCCEKSFLLSAGSDAVIRCWDLQEPGASRRVTGSPYDIHGGSHLFYKAHVESTTVMFEEILSSDYFDPLDEKEERSLAASQLAAQSHSRSQYDRGAVPPSAHHQDVITDLKALQYPQNLLLSSCRNGKIKVWI